MNKKLFSVLILLVLTLTLCGVVGCTPQGDANSPSDDEIVGNLIYDRELLSIDQAKALFSNDFNPLLPKGYQWGEHTYQKEYLPNNQQKPSTLLATKNNYYLTISNPNKYQNSPNPIYEAYSLIVATDSLVKSPTSYGVAQADLDALSLPLSWLESPNEDLNYFDINHFNGSQLGTTLSYVEYNAYSDTIKQYYAKHQYPRVDKALSESGKSLSVNAQSVKYHVYQEPNYTEVSVNNQGKLLISYKLYVHFKVGNVNYAIITPIGKVLYSANIYEAMSQGTQEAEMLNEIEFFTNHVSNFDVIAQKMTCHLVNTLIG
ncbi:MAG: hypothetical protein IJ033_06145 [Clostridia bacterium]|nr:hypothetical protein [Clostridia bacterium]